VLLRELEQSWHVDEHVVVSLEDELDLVAVGVDPLEGRDRLQRQVVVRVKEVGLDDVPVELRLRVERAAHFFVGHAAHQEADGQILAVAVRAPGQPEKQNVLLLENIIQI